MINAGPLQALTESPHSPAQHSREVMPNLLLMRKQTQQVEDLMGLAWSGCGLQPLPLCPKPSLRDQPMRGDQSMEGD